jgi:RNA polymerase sigma factor (sigma-70 family)
MSRPLEYEAFEMLDNGRELCVIMSIYKTSGHEFVTIEQEEKHAAAARETYKTLRKDGIKDMHNMELIKVCREDKELLGELLKNNRSFVFSIIMHFKGSIREIKSRFRVTDDELYQHACIGIVNAIRHFDFDRDIKFTTFVVRPILWEINQLLYSESQTVRLSRGAIDLIKKMSEIEDSLGYRPGEVEMASLLCISLERYREIAMFSDELDHYDGIENFDIAEPVEVNLDESVTNKVYVQQLLSDSMFNDFEKKVMVLVMNEANHSKVAEVLNVYPMTINRTLARIRSKIEERETLHTRDSLKPASKYEHEIAIIAQETQERNKALCIEDITELLEVCGCSHKYTTRVLYYIRQKAGEKVNL